MENLKFVRLRANLTQNQLANNLGINRSTYNGYEQGISEPSIETLKKIADYFDVSLDYLCGRQNKNLLFVDSLSEPQKKLIELIKPLSEQEVYRIIGYVENMRDRPVSDVINKIINGK